MFSINGHDILNAKGAVVGGWSYSPIAVHNETRYIRIDMTDGRVSHVNDLTAALTWL